MSREAKAPRIYHWLTQPDCVMDEDDAVAPTCAELPLERRSLEQRHRAAVNLMEIAERVKSGEP
jgi:hypothetical protein